MTLAVVLLALIVSVILLPKIVPVIYPAPSCVNVAEPLPLPPTLTAEPIKFPAFPNKKLILLDVLVPAVLEKDAEPENPLKTITKLSTKGSLAICATKSLTLRRLMRV